ncbi:hypothetical protein [Methylobacterium sp. J-090]|uniref:hypothetical protein n=1 Tax=Methylobacterium sp. J-090 TaxID=2836666 RepID=UPI001FB8AB94|nr:hypothetical protein [Methylobacterium sp. J-090]MCJ2081207.1 hypothetical protein [Methylobacterium sp. J-090]
MGLIMTNVVRFPASRRVPATTIPREEFERLAELALDVVDRIVALLNAEDGDADLELDVDGEPSLGAPENHHTSQVTWLRGGDRDIEAS